MSFERLELSLLSLSKGETRKMNNIFHYNLKKEILSRAKKKKRLELIKVSASRFSHVCQDPPQRQKQNTETMWTPSLGGDWTCSW